MLHVCFVICRKWTRRAQIAANCIRFLSILLLVFISTPYSHILFLASIQYLHFYYCLLMSILTVSFFVFNFSLQAVVGVVVLVVFVGSSCAVHFITARMQVDTSAYFLSTLYDPIFHQ